MEKEKKKVAKKTESVSKTKKSLESKKATKTSKKSVKNTKKPAKTANKTKKDVKNIKISGFNNLQLNSYIYDNVTSPKAVIVIVHGMMEHCQRYKNFAEFLNKNGYVVVTSDLRGHGKTAPSLDKLGYGEDDIFQETLKDQLNIISYVTENYNLPIYLFGHSYGSMLSQHLIELTPKIEKCVLCGTANGGSLIMKMGKLVANLMSPFKDEDKKCGLVEKLCIKGYEKGFENGNWLTRDEKVFEEYLKDEYCGGSFPFSFYKNLVRNMSKANAGIDKIGNKKIFLIAGSCDPVGGNGKQVEELYKIYLNHNIDAKIKIYKDARHELLNELNKNEVYHDILDFFDN